MKNTPFTVPEGFFEQAQEKALTAYAQEKKRRHTRMIACIAAAIVLAGGSLALHTNTTDNYSIENLYAQEILESYDCDIFLQNL